MNADFLKSVQIPPLPSEEEDQTFDSNSGIIVDPLSEFSEQETYGQVWCSNQNFFTSWTQREKDIFKEKKIVQPKYFEFLEKSLEQKIVSDCV